MVVGGTRRGELGGVSKSMISAAGARHVGVGCAGARLGAGVSEDSGGGSASAGCRTVWESAKARDASGGCERHTMPRMVYSLPSAAT